MLHCACICYLRTTMYQCNGSLSYVHHPKLVHDLLVIGVASARLECTCCREDVVDVRKVPTTQTFQNPFIKEYTLNHIRDPTIT